MVKFEVGKVYATKNKGSKFEVIKRKGDIVTFRGENFDDDRDVKVSVFDNTETCFAFYDNSGFMSAMYSEYKEEQK